MASSDKSANSMEIVPASDASLLVLFGDSISAEIEERVIGLFQALQALRDARIHNLNPGYTSLLVNFDPLSITHTEVTELVESLAFREHAAENHVPPIVEIPVCYDEGFGPDLPDVSAHTKLAAQEVIRLHSSATYRVCFLGFTAGFAYLGGMPQSLGTPRLPAPRRAVPAGSVGIAGAQ